MKKKYLFKLERRFLFGLILFSLITPFNTFSQTHEEWDYHTFEDTPRPPVLPNQ